MWAAVIGTLLAVFAGGLLYISFRAARFQAALKLARGKRGPARLLCLGFFAALTGLLWVLWGMMNAVVCLLHLVLFWMLADLAAFAVARIRKQPPRRYWAGAAAMVLCAVWLAGGWAADHHVRVTEYAFETDKLDREVRLVQITDSHIGATFHADGFGVYFVYGNHDKGYYAESRRGWTGAELRAALERNGVMVLEDESARLDNGLLIVGRKDRSQEQRSGGRRGAAELLSDADRSRYIVILDHQPHDFDAEAAAGADLVLCGHTHGGQFIPIRHVGEWIGENALRYGHERRLNTDFIVSSGISNWAFRFKTGCWSEIVAIDLRPRGGD